jgi:RNA polymerase sigma-70 factor (ECF subfamily)
LQARADVERTIGRLSDVKRITLLLAEVEGLSCAEIAAVLDVPIGTVWTRLHAARREIRQALGGGEES